MNTTRRSATRRRTAHKPAPLKLSDVNPRVRSTAMHAAGGDAKRIKVISKTEVVVRS